MDELDSKENPVVLPEILKRYAPHWEIQVSRERINSDESSAPLELYTNTLFMCGVCGSPNVTLIHRGGIGSVAGGSHWYEFECAECGSYTHYESEWG